MLSAFDRFNATPPKQMICLLEGDNEVLLVDPAENPKIIPEEMGMNIMTESLNRTNEILADENADSEYKSLIEDSLQFGMYYGRVARKAAEYGSSEDL